MTMFEKVVSRNFFVMGQDAVYTPIATGTPVDIKVIPSRPDEVITFQETAVLSESNIFDVQVADIAQPLEDDELEINGAKYIVQSARIKDTHRLIWRLSTRPEDEDSS